MNILSGHCTYSCYTYLHFILFSLSPDFCTAQNTLIGVYLGLSEIHGLGGNAIAVYIPTPKGLEFMNFFYCL